MCSSPRLFAAYHVFLRLSVPRHPPCALSCLTFCIQSAKLAVSCLFYAVFSHLFQYSVTYSRCFSLQLSLLPIFCLLGSIYHREGFSHTNDIIFDSIVHKVSFHPLAVPPYDKRCLLFCIRFSRHHRQSLDCRASFEKHFDSFESLEMVRFELMTPCLQGRCSPN